MVVAFEVAVTSEADIMAAVVVMDNLKQVNVTMSSFLQARDSHANRTEASKELLKKQKEQLSHGGKKRKRHDGKSDNVHHCNDGRILRSAKRLPRRSIRLVSKECARFIADDAKRCEPLSLHVVDASQPYRRGRITMLCEKRAFASALC
ncbi:hypothetical protein FXO38_18871 [Capsicum annuum]|nr:hypothetical protein FXO38_18871 [Capsicum annuum]